MSVHAFDRAIALEPLAEHEWQGRTSPDYANFIGPYGGVTAAQMLQAVMQHPQRLGEPAAFTINFAAALADGEFRVRARPVRTNRSTQHWVLEMLQDDAQPVATGTAMTAVRRETWGVVEAVIPKVPAPEDLAAEAVRGVAWYRRYERRYVEGNVPAEWNGQGGTSSRTRLWLRDLPPRPLDFASLTALADNFFPRLWLHRALRVPIGTVSMTVYYHADSALLQATGTDYLLGQAQGQGFRNGYLDQAAQIWNRQGDLLATTHQLMYYKE